MSSQGKQCLKWEKGAELHSLGNILMLNSDGEDFGVLMQEYIYLREKSFVYYYGM